MARSSCFSIDDGMEHYTLREVASPDSFRYRTVVRNMCCRCRVFTFSFQPCSRSWHFFDCVKSSSIASERAITTACEMISIFTVSHPSSCRVGKCQSRGVLNLSVPVFRTSEKLFFLPFSWFTECECRSGQDVVS